MLKVILNRQLKPSTFFLYDGDTVKIKENYPKTAAGLWIIRGWGGEETSIFGVSYRAPLKNKIIHLALMEKYRDGIMTAIQKGYDEVEFTFCKDDLGYASVDIQYR